MASSDPKDPLTQERITETSVEFTDQQMELIQAGIQDIEEGRTLTQDEAIDIAKKRAKAWIQAHKKSASA